MSKSSIRPLIKLAAAAMVISVTASAWAVGAPLPTEKHYGSVSYATGGIAQEEADTFRQAMRSYPLAIELLEKSGKKEEFTADAMVKIIDHAGKIVLDAKADGPFMLVRLEPGTYEVSAILGGKTLHKSKVTVHKGRTAQATFEFPPRTN